MKSPRIKARTSRPIGEGTASARRRTNELQVKAANSKRIKETERLRYAIGTRLDVGERRHSVGRKAKVVEDIAVEIAQVGVVQVRHPHNTQHRDRQ